MMSKNCHLTNISKVKHIYDTNRHSVIALRVKVSQSTFDYRHETSVITNCSKSRTARHDSANSVEDFRLDHVTRLVCQMREGLFNFLRRTDHFFIDYCPTDNMFELYKNDDDYINNLMN